MQAAPLKITEFSAIEKLSFYFAIEFTSVKSDRNKYEKHINIATIKLFMGYRPLGI